MNSLLHASVSAGGKSDDENTENEAEDEWEGVEDTKPPPIDHEAEYIDEEKYTTVTVEEMDISKDGLLKASLESEDSIDETVTKVTIEQATQKPRKKPSDRQSSEQKTLQNRLKKRKKRDFKYETKTERKVNRVKQRSKNSKQAKARRAG